MRCKDTQALLVAYQDGELAGRQEGRVRVHLDGCEGCRGELRALERTDELLRGHVVPPGPAPDFLVRLRERIRAEQAVEAAAPRGRIVRGPWQRGWAVAAAAVLLVAIGVGLFRQLTRKDASEPSEAVAQRAAPAPAPKGPTGLPTPAWHTPREWPGVERTAPRATHGNGTPRGASSRDVLPEGGAPAIARAAGNATVGLDAETEAAIVDELDLLENLEVVEGMDVLEAIDLLDDPALDLAESEKG